MRIGTFKPGDAKTRLGPNVNKAGKGKDGARKQVPVQKQKRG
jgi:hypothetical protein